MGNPNTILYLQHAGAIGGSTMSLHYTLQALDRTLFKPVVGLVRPTQELRELCQSVEVDVADMSGVTTYEHTTGASYGYDNPYDWLQRFQQYRRVISGAEATRQYVRQMKPDLVHLNSVVLAPSALGLHAEGVRFVWHVREHPVYGLCEHRLRWLRKLLLTLPHQLVFLSRADQEAWLGGGGAGIILPDFVVDTDKFIPGLDGYETRRQLGLAQDAPVVLFVGGISRIKGTIPLLDALRKVLAKVPNLRCLLPVGPEPSQIDPMVRVKRRLLRLLGTGTYYQRAIRLMQESVLSNCLCMPKPTAEVARFFAASDMLVFPSTTPHFARPVIEAAAMGKPCVASDIAGVGDLVEDGKTGLLTTPGRSEPLANAIIRLAIDPLLRQRMGDSARTRYVEKYCVKKSVTTIQDIYHSLLC